MGTSADRVKAIGATVTAIAAVASLFYWVGYNSGAERTAALKEQVETYRLAQSMEMTDLLKNLRSVAAEVDNDLRATELSAELAKLSTEKSELETAVAEKVSSWPTSINTAS